ncbi:MAG: hypothetical protein ACD_49C00011G0002 [uncultured bacterium (gcode 4)]|uniref:Lipoprotein n=1 Tax=uncultured bacterium (gcode 4) TaxID=1234023 RepID=K2BDC0_9BACT|nr:MAG: hypothetical protein ACD_49C00011G0002 [uncultured bacterium (gcode 4)]
MKTYKMLLLSFLLLLSSCSSSDEIKIEESTDKKTSSLKCSKDFQIWDIDYTNLKLKWVIETENVQNTTSSRDGILSFLDCENGKKVNSETLIATIKPDYDSPSTKSLISQKDSLYKQISNIESIIIQTKNNFSVQVDSLKNQQKDIESQIETQNINLENLEKQKLSWVWDLWSQKTSLEEQQVNLEKQKTLLEKSMEDDVKKITVSINNSKTQTKTLVWTILLQIDELYWISNKNRYLNDDFEMYIWVKNSSLKSKIESDFLKLDRDFVNILNKNDEEFLGYVENVLIILENIKINIKDSVSSINFPQTRIDNYYGVFASHTNNLLTSKNTLEWFIKSLVSTQNNYNTNIQSIQTQIDSIASSIWNINENKIDSYVSSIDSQINNLKIQIKNLKTNIQNISSQIGSLYSQEKIQISNYENQILTFKNNISSIDIQLSPLNIYSQTSGIIKQKQGTIWNKVTPQAPLCQIIPEKDSYKMKIYSPIELTIWQEITFDFLGEEITSKITKSNQAKDTLTQNYIYESDYLNLENIKEQEIFQVNIKAQNQEKIETKSQAKVYAPLDFIINKIDWYYIRKKDINWVITEEKINLWNVDWNMIEIKSWLNIGELICR